MTVDTGRFRMANLAKRTSFREFKIQTFVWSGKLKQTNLSHRAIAGEPNEFGRLPFNLAEFQADVLLMHKDA